MRISSAVCSLFLALTFIACGGDDKKSRDDDDTQTDSDATDTDSTTDSDEEPVGSPVTSVTLPFDPNDPNATFAAKLRVQDRAGNAVAASIVYDGDTYSTDGEGVISIPAVRVRNATGAKLSAPGYMPRSILLVYSDAGGDGLRVVLDAPGTQKVVDASVGGSVNHSALSISFAANSFVTAGGDPFAGNVTIRALGTDAGSLVDLSNPNEPGLRADFDVARIPQGFGIAVDESSRVHFLLPESVLQVELTDDAGNPLQVNTPASTLYHLSSMTMRQVGDVLPTYSFDDELQHWVQEGTCTVINLNTDPVGEPDLACAGTTPHFSTWMVASASDTQTPTCGNLSFRVGNIGSGKAYPASVQFSDGTTFTNPRVEVVNVASRQSASGAPVQGITPKMSASKTCFVQQAPFAAVTVRVTLAKLDGTQAKFDVFDVAYGASSKTPAPYYNANVALPKGDVDINDLAGTCGRCPVTFLEFDPVVSTPVASATAATATPPTVAPIDKCADDHCAAAVSGGGEDATCVASSGACQCASGLRFVAGTGCVAPNCGELQTFSDQTGTCVPTDFCADDPCIGYNACANIRVQPGYECYQSCDAATFVPSDSSQCVNVAQPTGDPRDWTWTCGQPVSRCESGRETYGCNVPEIPVVSESAIFLGEWYNGCNDGVDNDCDGVSDCNDPNCGDDPSCVPQNTSVSLWENLIPTNPDTEVFTSPFADGVFSDFSYGVQFTAETNLSVGSVEVSGLDPRINGAHTIWFFQLTGVHASGIVNGEDIDVGSVQSYGASGSNESYRFYLQSPMNLIQGVTYAIVFTAPMVNDPETPLVSQWTMASITDSQPRANDAVSEIYGFKADFDSGTDTFTNVQAGSLFPRFVLYVEAQ